ncbi:Tc toxin subunit A-related protein [Enhygromyxa salina]|uniref:Tc toxin subunit A-related protein n=1 Tax=Enhygromyxa salina TaxID=215803 RepID=UPI000D095334|nr:neuraminidase-like domain-containing protein [Enhygromyxa salina]
MRATDGAETVESPLISDLESFVTVDLVLGVGPYEGLTEWHRVKAKAGPLLGGSEAKDVPADRLEWLSRRADVFPTHLAAFIQAHRIADGRTVKAQSCYAFLRAGLPADLLGLVRAGESAWESALRDGWARILIPQPGDGSPEARDQEVADELAAMREIVVDAAVARPVAGVNQRVLLDSAALTDAQQRIFTQLWLAHSGPIEDFWAAVSGSSLGAEIPVLKFTIEAATLVDAHLETLEALQAERSDGKITTVADTARWSVAEWDAMLTARSVTAPDEIPGTDATERRQNYARALFNVLEGAYPSASLGAAITRDEQAASAPPHTTALATFLTNNPAFDIVESTIGHYLDGAVAPWAGVDPAEHAQARTNLEIVQRVYRLTPPIGRYATAKALLEQGITSATQIIASTRSEFVTKIGLSLPSDDHDAEALAGAVWDNAAKVHSLVVGLSSQLALAKTNADFVPVAFPGAEQFDEAPNGLAELSTILGNLDYCACEHCRSVFSPAAYLTDLLAFLKARPAAQAEHALEVLLARRPDLAHILLDCANTNTPLPYIDLVNELLEDFVDGGLGPSSKQTTWTAAELRLHPEHLDANVYEGATLTQAVHPWTLPFSLPTVEAQTYLRHLGVPRHELMRRVAMLAPSDASLDAIAGDVLGLDATSFEIVAGGTGSPDGREFWGFAATPQNDGWVGILNGTGEAGDVGELLRRARLELDALRELVGLDFINPDGNIALQWAETCELDDATIAFLDAPALDRIHRFVRLQRASQIPARLLNVLLCDALGGTLERTALRSLAEVVRLRDRLRLSWDELATFWATVIDARDREPRSLYTRRFLGKDLGPVDPDFFPAGDGSKLFGESTPATAITTAQLPRVLAGLGIGERDYQLLAASELASDAFSFANFTALVRCVVFARALRLSIAQFVCLVNLTGLDPFADPSASLAFVDQLDAIRQSGFSVDELDWLLRHEFSGLDPLDEATIGRSLAELAKGLATIEDEAARLEDPDGQALAANLAALLEPADVSATLELVDRSTALTPAERDAFIDASFAGILDVEAAKGVLCDYANEDSLEVSRRRAWLLGKVVGHLRRRALVLDTIAAHFGVPAMVAEALAMTVLTDPAGSAPLFEVYRLPFATPEQLAAGVTPTSHANEFAAWTRLAKAALVCERFELRPDQVAWYSGRSAWLDLDALPLDGAATDATFESWDRLRQALDLRDLSRPEELAPAEIAEAGTLAEAIGILAAHAGWDAAAVLSLATALGYDDTHAAAVAEELIPARLRLLIETAERLGVGLDVLLDWATPTPTMTQATAIKAATRAKYGEDRWPEVAKPLRDVVRERQRDALVDAAIAITPAFRTTNEVFEHLLIDVEMSACMMTSRIKQAIASVQIFIHRVLLHLDVDEVTFDPEAIERWGWMKNYRVWEANRKVFLYPENWVEPELRADKSPEFEELEANLMQGVLDPPRVEKALGAYLESLVRVANLEMIGVYTNPNTDELWLLGRTQASPHEWFVRRRLAAGTWEAWQAVPCGIDSDAVVICVHQGRLHLFWATEHEVALPEEKLAYCFRLHHLERGPDGWSKPTVSKPNYRVFLPKHDYRLHFKIGVYEITLTVLWQNPDQLDGLPGVAATFRYDPVEQLAHPRYRWMGTYLHDDQVDPVGTKASADVAVLNGKQLVALGQFDDFDGQRNVKAPTYIVDAPDVEPSSARFTQGDASVLVFDRPSKRRKTTFVHQANIWTPDGLSTLLPAIYDDRLRKYLLEPGYSFAVKDANPARIGHVKPPRYVACPPPAPELPQSTRSPKRRTQKLRDGIVELKPWTSGAPGRTPALGTLEVLDNPDAPAYTHGLLLANSQAMLSANLDLGVELEAYPADPQGFVLDMVELYHPFARDLQVALATKGLPGLYAPPTNSSLFRQQKTNDPFGEDEMGLNYPVVRGEIPIEEFDFEFDSPYANYNWEIFYHVPMLLAGKLGTEQRWEEAQSWFHLIFNPIDLVKLPGETETSKFWRIKPFFEQASILAKDQFEVMLGIGVTPAEQQAAVEAFARQVATWEANPFDPHAVARVRPGVYQRALLREYFDNLIAWADHLFRRDTIESITEATVLYIVVAQLLGRRPQEVPGPEGSAKTFAELDANGLDPFANAMIQLESWIHLPAQAVKKQGCGDPEAPESWVRVPVVSHFWYFCYPPNPELLKYWDILADRLFKIRHCQNIDGVERQLPLFEPPIDPALLVRATAAGVDIQSVLAELDSGLPPYRFRSVHARAMAFANSLRSLGASLLSAIEKRDAEELSRIRAGQELEMLARVREVRVKQRDEARAAIESLEAARTVIDERQLHYFTLIQRELTPEETQQFDAGKKAQNKRNTAQGLQLGASIASAFPQTSVFPPNASFGGLQLANVMNMIAAGYTYAAGEQEYKANRAGLTASFHRRAQDWGLQYELAKLEYARADKDIVAANIRLAIAEREIENHKTQLDHAQAVDEYMRAKFSNVELYDWMSRQLANLYFQTYQLAFDLAKRAERAYRHELAIPPSEPPIIEFGYWDSLRKGLLAGERLSHDLERLDLAYMDRDVREFELRKSISLAELAPAQLQALRETGACTFDLPEVLFDLDHPGHYLRRIRAVRLTIPAVVGPHTSLGASLQLLTHKTRREKLLGDYAEEPVGGDARFAYGTGAGQTIATSTALSDGGLFNLDFRDERYLPFEYAGAVSSWKLELPGKIRQFDYRTIEDVVVHIDYTARNGGAGLRTAAENSLVERFNSIHAGEPMALLLSVHEAFPNEWERFFEVDEGDHVLSLPILAEHFPYLARRTGFAVTKLSFAAMLEPSLGSVPIPDVAAQLDLVQAAQDFVQAPDDAFMTASFTLGSPTQPGTWALTVADGAIPAQLQTDGVLDPDRLAGMVLVLHYTLEDAP